MAGAAGPQGPPGIQSLTNVVASIEVAPDSWEEVTAPCPAGQKAVSGGVAFPGGGTAIWESQQDPTTNGRGWRVSGFNFNPTETFTLYAQALCSPNVLVNAVASTAASESQRAAGAGTTAAKLEHAVDARRAGSP